MASFWVERCVRRYSSRSSAAFRNSTGLGLPGRFPRLAGARFAACPPPHPLEIIKIFFAVFRAISGPLEGAVQYRCGGKTSSLRAPRLAIPGRELRGQARRAAEAADCDSPVVQNWQGDTIWPRSPPATDHEGRRRGHGGRSLSRPPPRAHAPGTSQPACLLGCAPVVCAGLRRDFHNVSGSGTCRAIAELGSRLHPGGVDVVSHFYFTARQGAAFLLLGCAQRGCGGQ